jgi:hypothetical protein
VFIIYGFHAQGTRRCVASSVCFPFIASQQLDGQAFGSEILFVYFDGRRDYERTWPTLTLINYVSMNNLHSSTSRVQFHFCSLRVYGNVSAHVPLRHVNSTSVQKSNDSLTANASHTFSLKIPTSISSSNQNPKAYQFYCVQPV